VLQHGIFEQVLQVSSIGQRVRLVEEILEESFAQEAYDFRVIALKTVDDGFDEGAVRRYGFVVGIGWVSDVAVVWVSVFQSKEPFFDCSRSTGHRAGCLEPGFLGVPEAWWVTEKWRKDWWCVCLERVGGLWQYLATVARAWRYPGYGMGITEKSFM
jgi:hypothetical protein